VSDITAMSEGLAKNLATIAGIRTYPQIPDNPALPAAVVSLITVDYDQAMQGGLTNYTFNVNVVVSRVTERRAQQRLYELIQTGTGSVKAAIESDRTLDGEAFDLRVTEMSDIVSTSIGDVEYLTANFVVIVRAY
jgi:hypothetical protein